MIETKPWDAAEFLTGWEGIREYLVATLEDGEPREVAKAFNTITRAPGLNDFADHLSQSVDRLKEGFADPQRADSALMIEVLNAIGWEISPRTERAEAA